MSRMVFMVAQPHSVDVMEQILARRMGISPSHFREHFDIICCQSWVDPFGVDPEVAKSGVKNLLPLLIGRTIILIGDEVARAFEMEKSEKYVRIDHPSWDDFHAVFYRIDSPYAPGTKTCDLVNSTMSMLYNITQEEKWAETQSA